MNKIGIYFAYWERNWEGDYLKYIKKVKDLGFDILEIAAGSLTDMTQSQKRLIADAAKDAGIKLTYCIGLAPRYDVSSPDEAVRREGIKYVSGLLDDIKFMGGDLIGGIIYACWPATRMSYDDKAVMRENAVNSVRELAKKAEDYGISYCLEVVNRFEQCLINTAAEGVELVKEIGSPAVKLLLDTFHMNIEEDSIGDAIHSAKDLIGHFHIGECNRKVPGKGHMPWNEIMEALCDVGYKGGIVMEPFIKPGGQVGQDIKVFRDLSGGADEAEMDTMAREALEFVRGKISGFSHA